MNDSSTKKAITVFTIGHSTLALKDFIQLLQVYRVITVLDTRTIPGSRHNPQFNRETLSNSLNLNGIRYLHMPGLGGLRRPSAKSPNMGWRNASFRGFADYMQTPEFEENLQTVITLASQTRSALMCAEAVPWRCHRSLIADALTIRGITVEHILNLKHSQTHAVTPWARAKGTRIIYPPNETAKPLDSGG